MRIMIAVLLCVLVDVSPVRADEKAPRPKNFIFFDTDRDRISEPTFLETKAIVGAQLKYTWRELEPQRDGYAFQSVLNDLKFLEAHGKRLFIQIQDVSFTERIPVPKYLVNEAEFGGGVARKYDFEGDDESKPMFDGWVARRWDPAVIARYKKLLEALAAELDGRIEGINLPESSIGFGSHGDFCPKGYTFENYAKGVKTIMTAAATAFERAEVIQYANFMPGEWLPWKDKGYLRGIYQHAERIGIGVGGPDLLPHRKGQQNHCLKLIAARGPTVVAGLAVQDGNLEEKNPETGKPVTVAQLHRYARDVLRLDYLFWGTQEPYYSRQVLPFLHDLSDDNGS